MLNSNKVKINFVGDVSLGEMFENLNNGVKSNILKRKINPFEFCQWDFINVDLNVINFECVLSNKSEKKMPFSELMRVPESFVSILKNNKINIVNLANNHSFDHGKKAFEDTIKILNSNNILTFGLNRNEWQEVPLIVSINGLKIGFLGYYIEESISNELLKKEILWIDNVLSNTRPGVDKLVLSLHWGHEYTSFPKSWQLELAKEFISKYHVDLIYGHHTHRLNGVMSYLDGIIAPSLGNFVFDEKYKSNRLTAILKVLFDKNENKSQYDLIPYFINNKYQPTLSLKYKIKLDKLSFLLEKISNLDNIDKNKSDRKSKRISKIGHFKNKLKVYSLFFIRFFYYLPHIKNLVEYKRNKIKGNS